MVRIFDVFIIIIHYGDTYLKQFNIDRITKKKYYNIKLILMFKYIKFSGYLIKYIQIGKTNYWFKNSLYMIHNCVLPKCTSCIQTRQY